MPQTSNISYTVQQGKGLPIVLLHGLCEDSSIWDSFIEPFADRYIIRIDLPGFGGSEVYGNGSIRAMAEGIHKVLQKEQVQRSIMIGHSMGGYVALAYAQMKGNEKLAGFGLIHSHPYEDSQERKDTRKKNISHIDLYGTSNYIKHFFSGLTTPEYAEKHPEVINQLIDKGLRIKSHGIVNALDALRTRKEQTHTLKDMTCPVLFVIGEKDQIIPKNSNLTQLTLPNTSEIHILPDVGHLAMLEAEAATQKIVRKYIALCELLYE